MCHSSGKLGVFGKLEPNETEQKYEMEPAQSGARARHMDDDEARYLIDQFNKYVSWRVRRTELWLVETASLVSVIALGIVLLNQGGYLSGWVLVIYLVIWTLLMLLGHVDSRRIDQTHKRLQKRIEALESYRFRSKSLPDEITFSKIIDPKLKQDDLRELLERAEQDMMKRGHT